MLDACDRLIGTTFGYKDEGSSKLICAYPMDRVQSELSALGTKAK